MSDSKNITAWLLLGLLTVAGAGFAVLGVVQSHVALDQAVSNTLAADSYSEVFTESCWLSASGSEDGTARHRPGANGGAADDRRP